jgi:hypothetical protein
MRVHKSLSMAACAATGAMLVSVSAASATPTGVTVVDQAGGDFTLSTMTVTRPDGSYTYSPQHLIGVAVHDVYAVSTPVLTGADQPVPPPGERASLLEDWRLDTGIINPFSTGAPADQSFHLVFDQPIVNTPGPNIIVLEVGAGDPTAFWVNDDRVNHRLNVTAAQFTGPLVTAMPYQIWFHRHPETNALINVVGLEGLENPDAVFTLDTSGLINVVGIGLDLSDFGIAPGESITSLRFQTTSTTSRIDPTLIAGLPVLPAASQWAVDAGGAWTTPGNWTDGVPNAPAAPAIFGPVISQGRTVTVDEPVTVGSLTFNSANTYTIDGPGGITVAVGPGRINVDSGSHAINTPLDLQVNTTFNVAPGGALAVSNLLNTTAGVAKDGAGLLQVNRVASNSLAVNAGTLQLLPGGGASKVQALSVADGATLDLGNNEIIVQNGDLQAINNLVVRGYAGGSWTGDGISSSAAAAAGDRSLGIGMDGSDVRVAFTYSGDATLDGSVTIADLGVLAANWQGADKYWFEGDFNYDGSVNIADLGILAGNWQAGTGGGGMSFEEALAMFDVFNGVVVPEPAALGLVGLGLLAIRRRR